MQTEAIPAKDSFQSGSQLSPGSGARHAAAASDIVDSDSELEVPVQPESNFPQHMNPVKTYKSFAEADAAAEEEKRQYSDYAQNQDVTIKSAFKGGAASSNNKMPNDNFARVTWTDLAMGGGPGFGAGSKASRVGSRAGSRSAKRTPGGLMINEEVANFSLANQDKKIGEEFEEMKSETEQDEPE